MRRAALHVAIVCLLLLAPVGGAQAQAALTSPETQIHVAVQEDGDARWSVAVRIPLETANQTAAFEALREDFTDGTGEDYLSVAPFREAADRVSTRTDQQMAIVDVQRSAQIRTTDGRSVGVLRLSFTWTNFARIGEEQVRVGEAFEGGWFGDLGPNQTLLIEPPPGYKVHNVEPLQAVTNGTLRWDGPQTFGPGQPVVTFVPVSSGLLGPIPVWALAGLGLVLVAGAGLLAWRIDWNDGQLVARVLPAGERGEEEPEPPSPSRGAQESIGDGSEETGAGNGTGASPDSPPADARESQTRDTPEDAPAGDHGGEGPSGAQNSPGEPDDAENGEELLSDAERVERLLRENGGRMKQARIVEETRWSNAKVSQLLSSMAEDDRVEKLRLGRENLISLPDQEDFTPGDERE